MTQSEGIVLGVLWGSAVGCFINGWPIAGLLLFAGRDRVLEIAE